MTRKTRYILILIGFFIFLIIAPIIVLYVRGVTYDFASGKFVKTGIIAVKTVPSSANIFLDDKLAKEKAGNIKFLKPKEYQLRIEKEGYHTWEKRLNVESGQVTWAGSPFDKIYLLKKDIVPKNLGQEAIDFTLINDDLIYLTRQELVITNLNDIEIHSILNVNEELDQIITSNSGSLLVLKNSDDNTVPKVLVLKREDLTITDLSNLFANNPTIEISENNRIYALDNNNLYTIDYSDKENLEKNLVASGVLSFKLDEDNLYIIKNNLEKNPSLEVSLQDNPNNTVNLSSLPKLTKAEIIINSQKEILLLNESNLYRITNAAELISQNILSWNLGSDKRNIIFAKQGELSYYDSASQELKIITRSQKEFSSPKISNHSNFAFAFAGNELIAYNMDTSVVQSQYLLFSAKEPKKILLHNQEKNIISLDKNGLQFFNIR